MIDEGQANELLGLDGEPITHHSSLITHHMTAPSVSVVIPCFNEERFIGKVLDNLIGQYEHECYEIIVVDGLSTDDTRKVVADFAGRNTDLRVRIIDNPARHIPTALNLGIREARGEIIVRMDAHSIPSANYVRRCVERLTSDSPSDLSGDPVSVVGMPWHIQPGADSLTARAIALAVAHPFGIGDAKYRLETAKTQFVDTVPFGAFQKKIWEELGGFNEDLLTNEDYDFNYRARLRGGRILMDTAAHCDYFARPKIGSLAKQYFRYGSWKAQMLKLHPRSIKLRQLIPPAFVLYLVTSFLLGLWWTPALTAFSLVLAVYILLAGFFGLSLASKAGNWKLFPILPVIFFVLHIAWGSSFLLRLIPTLRR
jgi:glycosyltransferase involved in cell wall biosynthesis